MHHNFPETAKEVLLLDWTQKSILHFIELLIKSSMHLNANSNLTQLLKWLMYHHFKSTPEISQVFCLFLFSFQVSFIYESLTATRSNSTYTFRIEVKKNFQAVTKGTQGEAGNSKQKWNYRNIFIWTCVKWEKTDVKESNHTFTGDLLPFVLLLTKTLFCEIYFLNFCTLKLQLEVAVGLEIQHFFSNW